MNQKWVPYPAYTDRAGWDELLGTNKENLIRAGEKMLNYGWKVIRATDYLEYERSGERNIMQNPYEANRKAINVLTLAELDPKKYEHSMNGGQWVDNPKYDATAPEYDGVWKNWNPKKIWVPSKEGLGLRKVFDMFNELYPNNKIQY